MTEIRCGCGAALAFCPDCCRWYHAVERSFRCKGEDAHACGTAPPDTPREVATAKDAPRLLSRASWSRPASSRAQARHLNGAEALVVLWFRSTTQYGIDVPPRNHGPRLVQKHY